MARLVEVEVDAGGRLTRRLDRDGLRQARRREGRYLLRTNLADTEPDTLWRYYMQLTAVEESSRTLKGDLKLRPIYHQKPERIEAHLFVAFLAYCFSTTLRQQLRGLAGGLMPRTVLEKLSSLMMLNVSLPTLDAESWSWLVAPSRSPTSSSCSSSWGWSCPISLRRVSGQKRPKACSPDHRGACAIHQRVASRRDSSCGRAKMRKRGRRRADCSNTGG